MPETVTAVLREGFMTGLGACGITVDLPAADGPDRLEPLSGMAHLTGIPIDVCPARGPLASDSWSGIAPG